MESSNFNLFGASTDGLHQRSALDKIIFNCESSKATLVKSNNKSMELEMSMMGTIMVCGSKCRIYVRGRKNTKRFRIPQIWWRICYTGRTLCQPHPDQKWMSNHIFRDMFSPLVQKNSYCCRMLSKRPKKTMQGRTPYLNPNKIYVYTKTLSLMAPACRDLKHTHDISDLTLDLRHWNHIIK